MPHRTPYLLFLLALPALAQTHVPSNPGNRLVHINDTSPFYPHLNLPKLITPQWVGEDGVEAVVTLGIDDMREAPKYEQFLRPILERLKAIDGRAPVSILTCRIAPDDPQVQKWLKEGLSIEVHTLTHPCPLLQRGNLKLAANTVHGGVDLLNQIPGNTPVAYRMPCCDSMNSLSPRFFAEIFNKVSEQGNHLEIDSSVFNIITSRDKSLPRELVMDGDGGERFAKYLPRKATRKGMRTMGSYVGTIENYPYPYVVNRLCWEFPCVVPSDWEAQNLIGNQQPQMLEDWKRALDVTVQKQGVMNLVFHPHGWSSSSQIVELIDYAWKKYGKKVKFLNFGECAERLNKNLLKGSSLRKKDGGDNAVRVLDANNDGYMDVLIGETKLTRVWNPARSTWIEYKLPFDPMQTLAGVLGKSGAASMMDSRGDGRIWTFRENGWQAFKSNPMKQPTEPPSNRKEILKLISTAKPAVERITDNEGEKSDWYDFTGKMTSRHLIRQLVIGKALNWESPMVKANPKDSVVLCLTGGLGYEIQPKTDGFMLSVDGRDRLQFDLSQKFERWSAKDGSIEMVHLPTWITDLDSGGYYFFILPKGTVKEDRSIRFSVRSLGSGSRRWFAIDAKQDVADNLRKLPGKIKNPNDRLGFLRDVDSDGVCELVSDLVYGWDSINSSWKELQYRLPEGIHHSSKGLRFVDLNGDKLDDIVFSDEERWGIHLWETRINRGLGWKPGWSHIVREGKREDKDALPMISRGGLHPNNGAWFHSDHLWVQNEGTAHLPDVVDRRSFKQLLDFGGPLPKEPEESRLCFKVAEGFEVQLAASEPHVLDPVALDWGADGKLWVAEMGDYPLGIDGKGNPGGMVRWLEDIDGNGHYEKSTVFLDGLNFPTGVMAWNKGVLVSAAPDIIYAEDTNGDGRADVRRILFTGFREGNQQHRMNGFALGLDNWIYAANGDSGGIVKSLVTDQKVNIAGHDFRFKVTGELETVAGQTQFGRWRDDWGNWFGNNNPNWLWHYHIPIRYLARNKYLPVPATRKNTFSSNRLFPISPRMKRPNMPHAYGRVTSANSANPYRGGSFVKVHPSFARSVFISEPVHNLVHREVLEPNGISFKGRRAKGDEKREFLASTDNWFRPTQIKTGPDGGLYIADMYRLVIEHPEWIPAAMQSRIDLRAGSNRGRIWRIVPQETPHRPTPHLASMNVRQLVEALNHPNGWQRDTAQRLLVERMDKSAVPQLENVLRKTTLPQTRIHALYTLKALSALDKKILSPALRDKHEAVREHAVRLCEGGHEALARQCLNDKSVRVLRQVAFTLGEGRGSLFAEALLSLASRHPNDADIQLAIKSSAVPHAAEMLKQGFSIKARPPAGLTSHLLQITTTGKQQDTLALVLNEIADGRIVPNKFTMLDGFLDALESSGQTLGDFHTGASPVLQKAIEKSRTLFSHARANPDNPSAIALLGRSLDGQDADLRTLIGILSATRAPELQKAAMKNLGQSGHPKLANEILDQWHTYSPTVYAGIIEVLLSRENDALTLLKKVQDGGLPSGQVSPAFRQRLTGHPKPEISELAKKLFGQVNTARDRVIRKYANMDKLKGEPTRGKALFKAVCANCHRFRNEGNAVGPDLETFIPKSPIEWLTAILDPNRAVEEKFIGYNVSTRNGVTHTGVITAETPASLTLRTLSGQEHVILRNNIRSLKGTGLSLMPVGLETTLPPQAMADLLKFLRGN
jgi:putative membrane-bound dehydrogenase-like protein